MQYFLKKNADLQFSIRDRFCERPRQYTTLWSEFTKLFRSEGLGYEIKNINSPLEISPLEIKNINSLQKFKTEIRKWAPENCSCYLCRPYLQNFGFVELV